MEYLYTSERIGFRPWTEQDENNLFLLCSNKEVMRYFDKCLTKKTNRVFLDRLLSRYEEVGLTYYAVELLGTQRFIGMIGLAPQTYEAPFNPSVDMGWRLLPEFWHKGYATEGAMRTLRYGFEDVQLDEIVAVCSVINKPSERVMQRIGMERKRYFSHVNLADYPEIQPCVQYAMSKESFLTFE